MKFSAYPIKCDPILKESIWGGTKLKSLLNKNIISETTGESWELSAVPDNVSIIANGAFTGKSLAEVIESFSTEILGTAVSRRFGNQFPLLFKFIDAKKDLSIQVHPDDTLAKKRHNSFGKTEMWYIIQADEGARLIVGFNENVTPEVYSKHLHDNTLLDILDQITVSKGDVFLLEAGTVHAIGGGIVLAEIQQTSDITYRIYDFDRKDADGNFRPLHVKEAVDAINFAESDTKKIYGKAVNTSNLMVDGKYFRTSCLPLSGELDIAKNGTSFTVYMCVEGSFEIVAEGQVYPFSIGDTVLIPAALRNYKLSGKASLLEIYIS